MVGRPRGLTLLFGSNRTAEVVRRIFGKAFKKEERELLQSSFGLMQFPVGVALRDLANVAAGQVTKAAGQQTSSLFSDLLFFFRGVAAIEVGVIKICSPQT